jgi:hypothetical protein
MKLYSVNRNDNSLEPQPSAGIALPRKHVFTGYKPSAKENLPYEDEVINPVQASTHVHAPSLDRRSREQRS